MPKLFEIYTGGIMALQYPDAPCQPICRKNATSLDHGAFLVK